LKASGELQRIGDGVFDRMKRMHGMDCFARLKPILSILFILSLIK
jgi:hypothetical protein